jgi:hypothetical protein
MSTSGTQQSYQGGFRESRFILNFNNAWIAIFTSKMRLFFRAGMHK